MVKFDTIGTCEWCDASEVGISEAISWPGFVGKAHICKSCYNKMHTCEWCGKNVCKKEVNHGGKLIEVDIEYSEGMLVEVNDYAFGTYFICKDCFNARVDRKCRNKNCTNDIKSTNISNFNGLCIVCMTQMAQEDAENNTGNSYSALEDVNGALGGDLGKELYYTWMMHRPNDLSTECNYQTIKADFMNKMIDLCGLTDIAEANITDIEKLLDKYISEIYSRRYVIVYKPNGHSGLCVAKSGNMYVIDRNTLERAKLAWQKRLNKTIENSGNATGIDKNKPVDNINSNRVVRIKVKGWVK